MRIYVLILLAASIWAKSDLDFAPQNFLDEDGFKRVFVDFQTADYRILFDTKSRSTRVYSDVEFYMPVQGFPVFDLVKNARRITVDGAKTQMISVQTPKLSGDPSYTYRSINTELTVGFHRMKIYHLGAGAKYANIGSGVTARMSMTDLTDRMFLEQYLPTNMEYDLYTMNFDVEVLHTNKDHDLILNCDKSELQTNRWVASCPSHYNSSALFFHLIPKWKYKSLEASYRSIDGRDIDIRIYRPRSAFPIAYTNLNKKMKEAFDVMAQLETDFGPWPYDFLIVEGWMFFRGGMEFAGAMSTSYGALDHEMQHSYFARGIRPARGNAGWIDEGLARWGDNGYNSAASFNQSEEELKNDRMANTSPYRRSTSKNSYERGSRVFAYLNHRFQGQGGLKPFLKNLVERRLFTQMTTELLHQELEEYFQADLSDFFNRNIYVK